MTKHVKIFDLELEEDWEFDYDNLELHDLRAGNEKYVVYTFYDKMGNEIEDEVCFNSCRLMYKYEWSIIEEASKV